MSKFTGVPLEALHERLGRQHSRGMGSGRDLHRHTFNMLWYCNGPNAPACLATAESADVAMPHGLTAQEQEFFETAPFPKDGWTLRPCPTHHGAFTDFPEEPE